MFACLIINICVAEIFYAVDSYQLKGLYSIFIRLIVMVYKPYRLLLKALYYLFKSLL